MTKLTVSGPRQSASGECWEVLLIKSFVSCHIDHNDINHVKIVIIIS